ncbi:MAG: SPOR domain-containing protein [Desulfobacterales bacterium]|nr:SPOR domain-containing protein [Desulfobacterales bacterium]
MGKTKKGAAKKRQAYLQLTRRGAYGSLLLIALACAWMFFIGVLVGRGTAPVRFDMEALSRELKALKQASEERHRRQLESYAAALEDQSDLDVYEELKRADDQLTIDPALRRRVPAPSERTEAAESAQPAEPAAVPLIRRQEGLRAKTADRPALTLRPAATEKKPPPADTVRDRTPAVPRGDLTVQVAAVKDARVARQMVTRLRGKGFEAYQSTAAIPGQGTWYRVRVGRYTDRKSAADTMRRLKGQGLTPIIIAY